MSVEEKFNAAVGVIRNLPKDGPYQPSHDMMLKFYGLYKQATEGPCNESKPAFYEVVKGYKWRAWKNLSSMSKEEAMGAYVDELKKIIETMSYTENVANFTDSLGPFYEYIDILGYGKAASDYDEKNQSVESSEDKPAITSNGDVICNGNGQIVAETNGKESESASEDEGIASAMPSIKSKKGSESASDEDGPLKNNGFVKVSLPHENLDVPNPTSEVIDIDHNHEHFTNSNIVKKLVSDTESDEEYSEPVEAPEFLLQADSKKTYLNSVGKHQQEINHASNGRVACRPKALTCGGGDAGNAGNLRKGNLNQGTRSSRDMTALRASDNLRMTEGVLSGGGGGRDGRQRPPPRQLEGMTPQSMYDDVNSQLVLILHKIHQDLQGILVRLNSLESQAFGGHQQTCHLCQKRSVQLSEKNWWPFPELSPRSTFFLLTWPLILKGLLKLFVFLRSRRRQR